MQKVKIHRSEMKLVGISIRTNNRIEQDPDHAVISQTIQRYFQEAIPSKIADAKNPGVTICAYLDYEGDYTDDYTYFIGEEVSSFEDLPDGLETATISAQTYIKFTTEEGEMPNVVINAWLEIWQMNDDELGGIRAYKGDFELYDQRAHDASHTVIDIYIGID